MCVSLKPEVNSKFLQIFGDLPFHCRNCILEPNEISLACSRPGKISSTKSWKAFCCLFFFYRLAVFLQLTPALTSDTIFLHSFLGWIIVAIQLQAANQGRPCHAANWNGHMQWHPWWWWWWGKQVASSSSVCCPLQAAGSPGASTVFKFAERNSEAVVAYFSLQCHWRENRLGEGCHGFQILLPAYLVLTKQHIGRETRNQWCS